MYCTKNETNWHNISEFRNKTIHLQVHPFVEAFLKRGVKSIQRGWFLKYKKWIQVTGLTKFGMMDYQFVDENNQSFDD